jgi:hypothetical protein
MEGTVRLVLAKLNINLHVVVDSQEVRFSEQEHVSTYFSEEDPEPIKILKAPTLLESRSTPIEPARDRQNGI